jgi:small-conductance mechanosensitive channel
MRIVLLIFVILSCLYASGNDNKIDLFTGHNLPQLEIDENENSQEIIKKFFESISTRWAGGYVEKLKQEGDKDINRLEHDFNIEQKRAENRLLELEQLINSQPDYAPYFASFYFRQLADLRDSFSQILASLQRFHMELSITYDELGSSLQMVEALHTSQPELHWQKSWISYKVGPQVNMYQTWLIRVACLIARAQYFQDRLETAYAKEEKIIQNQYRNYYHYRFEFLGNTLDQGFYNTLHDTLSRFNEWKNITAPMTFDVIAPNPEFYRILLINLALFVVLAVVFAFFFNKKFGTSFRSLMKPYLCAWAGAYFITSIFFLPSTNDILIFSFAGFFLITACNDGAWMLRRKTFQFNGMNPLALVAYILLIVDLMISMQVPVKVLLLTIMLLSFLELCWIIFIFSCYKHSVAEKIHGGAIMGISSLFSFIAAYLGYLYPAMLVIVTASLTACSLYGGSTFTQFLVESVKKNAPRQIITSFIFTLIIPLLWLGLIIGCLHWGGNIFNAGRLLEITFSSNLLPPSFNINISLKNVLYLIVIGLLLKFFLTWIRHMAEIFNGSKQYDPGSLSSAFLIFQYFSWSAYIIYCLNSLNIDWQRIMYVVGGLSVGLGFALKDLLENFVCGLILLVGKEIRPGDIVEFDGTWGVVTSLNIRCTFIRTFDNAVITLPNNQVVSKNFRNWTLNGHIMRHQMEIGVSYGTDVNKAAELLLKAANDCDMVMKVRDPEVLFVDFGDSALIFRLRYWLHIDNLSKAPSQIRRNIADLFQEAGIVIAFPQIDVHINSPSKKLPVNEVTAEEEMISRQNHCC